MLVAKTVIRKLILIHDELRLDVSARLGKVISRQLLVKGIVVAISVAILLGTFEKVLNK